MSTALALTLEDYVVRRVQELERQNKELIEKIMRLQQELERLNGARLYVANRVKGRNYDDLMIDGEYSSRYISELLERLRLPLPYEIKEAEECE